MKQLTIINGIPENDISSLEASLAIDFPTDLKSLLLLYNGCQTKEHVFKRDDGVFESINTFLKLRSNQQDASVEAIFEGHAYYNIKGFIPFAIDSGGWDYNVSINSETYGQVWINQFDSGEEDTMKFVATSLEIFINGLISEEEAIAQGY